MSRSRVFSPPLPLICIDRVYANFRIEADVTVSTHLNTTFAHSKVKGFMWLFCSHALPGGTRMWGKNAGTKCPQCYEEEDIYHGI
jgi:hypothetical protein